MKNKIIYSAVAAILFFSACSTIEDRDSLGPLLDISQIQIDVHGFTDGSNKIVMINNTSHVAGMWDYIVDKSTRQNDTILLPFLGKSTIYFYAETPGGIVKDSAVVNVTKIDYPAAPQWTYFAGSGSAGKTWVWATDANSGKPYGNGPYLENMAPGWWQCSATDLAGWGVLNDEMTFDLNGGANYTLKTGSTDQYGLAAGTYKGNFKFDMSKTKAMGGDATKTWAIGQLNLLGNVTVSRGWQPNESHLNIYQYDILMLNDNQMILSYPEAGAGDWGTAWFWMFKQKGTTWPAK
jgi:hypothetical protein